MSDDLGQADQAGAGQAGAGEAGAGEVGAGEAGAGEAGAGQAGPEPGPEQRAAAGPWEQVWSAGLVEDPRPRRPRSRKRRVLRIAMASAAAMVVLVAGVAVTGYAIVNHLADNIRRIPGVFGGLDAAERPAMPAATRHSMTILLTGSDTLPAHIGGHGALGSSTAPEESSGLIALVHINADRRAGAIVRIPPDALVDVPGHGVTQLWNTLPLGGPSLLIRAVESLTDVRIDHYSVVNFDGLTSSLGPLGGVNVELPETIASNGVVFRKGMNHLNGSTALDYLKQHSLSRDGLVLRQQALLRAILAKLGRLGLLTNPTGGFSILNAFTKALSVDSNFTNSELVSLALSMPLVSRAATFVSAPVRQAFTFEGQGAVSLSRFVCQKLWRAIRHDAVAAFARRYPSTVTPIAPH